MKKRFLNILTKPRKRNGLFILACAMILAACLETLVGCSAADDPKDNEITLPCIKESDGKKVSFGAVEWVEIPGEHAVEFGILSEDDAPSGSVVYVYYEDTMICELPLASYIVLNPKDGVIYE